MRILFADDHRLVREALTWFLSKSQPDIEVVGANSVEEALPLRDSGAFDLILLDYKLQGVSGAQAIQIVRQTFEGAPIIVLSGAITLEEANHALTLGVAGVISKDIDGELLWDTILGHVAGASSISPSIEGATFVYSGDALSAFTNRERQVAELLIAGHANKTIAFALGIAEITVRLYLRQVYRKLGAHSRTDAVRIMLSNKQH